MRALQRIFLTLACLTAVACAPGRANEARIEAGFVASANGAAYLYTTDGQLAAATPIRLQYPAAGGAAQCCLRLQGDALEAPSGSSEPVTDALFGHAVFRYRMKQLPAALKGDPFIGAAVTGAAAVDADPTSAGTALRVAAEPGRPALQLKICLGSEGSNLFLIAGDKLKAQLYYAFGYDVSATCDARLFDLPTAP